MNIKYGLLTLKAKAGLVDHPFTLQIYLDSVCNLDCWFCLYKNRDDIPRTFDLANLDKLDKAIKEAGVISISSCGESLASKYLPAVLEKVYALNSKSDLISMVTNGLLLSADIARLLEGHLADLTVSINARAVEQTKAFVDALRSEDKHKIGLHFLAYAENLSEIPGLVDIAIETGVSRIRVDQFMVAKQEHLHLSLLKVMDRYNVMVEQARLKADYFGIKFFARTFGTEHGMQKCLSPWTECHIWADGRVAPCCYNGGLFLGNAYESSFEDVWFGESYHNLRKDGSEQCRNCPKVLPFDDRRVHIYPSLREKVGNEKDK
jgi:MoaA/NifB/PqqE/SkfB family radical SAM enzyme